MGAMTIDAFLPLVMAGAQIGILLAIGYLGRMFRLNWRYFAVMLLPFLALAAIILDLTVNAIPSWLDDSFAYNIAMLGAIFFAAPVSMTWLALHVRKLRQNGVDVTGVFE